MENIRFPCNQLTFGNPCYKRLLMLLHWFNPINEERRLIIRENKSGRQRQRNEPRTRKPKDWLYDCSWRFLEGLEGRLFNWQSAWRLPKKKNKITHVISYTISLEEQWIKTKEHMADDFLNLSTSTQMDCPGASWRTFPIESILKFGKLHPYCAESTSAQKVSEFYVPWKTYNPWKNNKWF